MHSLTVKDKITETKKNEARPPAQQLHIFQTASHHVSQQQSGVDHQAVRGRLPVAHGTWNMGATMSAEYSYRIKFNLLNPHLNHLLRYRTLIF